MAVTYKKLRFFLKLSHSRRFPVKDLYKIQSEILWFRHRCILPLFILPLWAGCGCMCVPLGRGPGLKSDHRLIVWRVRKGLFF